MKIQVNTPQHLHDDFESCEKFFPMEKTGQCLTLATFCIIAGGGGGGVGLSGGGALPPPPPPDGGGGGG